MGEAIAKIADLQSQGVRRGDFAAVDAAPPVRQVRALAGGVHKLPKA